MKIKIPSLNRIIMGAVIVLFALLEVKWFYLPGDLSSVLVKFNYDGKNTAIAAVAVIMTVLQLILFNNTKMSFVFKKHIFILWTIWLTAYPFTVFVYGQDELYTLSQFCYFALYILYFTLQWYFDSTGNYEAFCSLFSVCSAVFSILICVQAYILQQGGQFFLTVSEFAGGSVVSRNNMIRIMAPSILLSFCSLISFARLFQGKKHRLICVITDIVNAAAGTAYVFYASGTRALMLVQILTIGIVFICMRKRDPLRIVILFSAAIIVLFIAASDGAFRYIRFDTNENSFQNRIGAFGYFLEKGILNPICGLGFLTDHSPEHAALLHGPEGTYYISDVGLCGFAGQMGIIAAIVYLAIVVKIWRLVFKLRRITNHYNTVMLATACFMTLTLPTLSLQTNYSIIAMVLGMTYAEYEYRLETRERNMRPIITKGQGAFYGSSLPCPSERKQEDSL